MFGVYFVLISVAAAGTGYAFGVALHLWEAEESDAQHSSLKRFGLFMAIVSLGLLIVVGAASLLREFWLLTFIVSVIAVFVGFRLGHPSAANRIRAAGVYLRGFYEIATNSKDQTADPRDAKLRKIDPQHRDDSENRQ